jgi:uncharacterized protein YcbK (DUF882 family)
MKLIKERMKLTKNFDLKEFECKCGCKMPLEVYENVIKLAGELQKLRTYLDRPIRINSAYRCESHNYKSGGSKTSQHLLGKASDVVVDSLKPAEVHRIVEDLIGMGEMLQGGLGLYDTFLHYDIRKSKARWDAR